MTSVQKFYLRLALKHRQDIRDPMQCSKSHGGGLSALRRYLSKLFLRLTPGSKKSSSRSEKDKQKKKQKQKQTAKQAEKCLLTSKDQIPDEFLFVILPDKLYTDTDELEPANKKNLDKNLKPSSEESAKRAEAKLLKDRLYRLSETRGPTSSGSTKKRRNSTSASRRRSAKERRRSSGCFDPTAAACIKRRKDTPIRQSIRNQLALKTHEVDRLYDREYALTKELTKKSKLFKLQNALYTNPERQLELSVGQIQRNIENYAEEIVRTEHELLELKNEIKQDISIINNLKRMTLESAAGDVAPQPQAKTHPEPSLQAPEATANLMPTAVGDDRMQFVDNIYEFCDNNASMLV